MRPLDIVETEVLAYSDPGFPSTMVRSQIHLLVFDAPPYPLDKEVVQIAPLSIHADRDSIVPSGAW